MTTKEQGKKTGVGRRTEIGYWGSLVYGGLLLSYIIHNWGKLADLPPNELGDFTAGAFGPLAILWLVLGYFQQGDELQQNTEALRLQAEELANSVQQQQKLVMLNRQESERLAAAARPRFEAEVATGHRESNEDTFISVSLKNVGAPCSHLRVMSITKGVTAYFDYADPGSQDRSITVSSRGPERLENADVLVSYIDSAGAPGSHRFTISFYADEDCCGYAVSGDDDQRAWSHSISAAID